MTLINLVVGLALIQYLYFSAMVGAARGRYGVAAPATSGHDLFDRHYRVQMNTLELLVALIPSLYGFAYYYGQQWAAALGAVYVIGRILYYRSYLRDPKSRSLGFGLSIGPVFVFTIGTVVGAITELVRSHAG